MEVRNDLRLDEAAVFTLEMHSFLNVLTIISGILQYFRSLTQSETLFSDVLASIHRTLDAIEQNQRDAVTAEELISLKSQIVSALEAYRNSLEDSEAGSDYRELTTPLDDILAVMDIRIAELRTRGEDPDAWELIDARDYEEEFRHFFHAVQKNSLGRYRIIHNLAEQNGNDYLVNLKIDSDAEHRIPVTVLLKDVIRDIVANARKYTAPGGEITIGISFRENRLRFVCVDTGMGIPEEELEKVVEYKYRATNADHTVRTMGNGSGLTKAWYVTRKLGGRMWLESTLGKGTKVTLEIPVPAQAFSKAG